ncbi:unnamed protein product, partial [marine sediment metagenome]
DPSHSDMAQVLNLFRDIPGRTCTAAAYLEYLNINWLLVAIFIVRKEGKIIGFTQAAAPGQLDPKCAWLPFSHALPSCPHQGSQEAVELAIEWMKGFGANKFKVETIRSPRAFSRKWGMRRSKEVLMEKDI